MSATTQDPLAGANKVLAQAHKRVAEIRERQRSIQLEGESVAGAIERALFEAGRDGGEPDVAELRDRIVALQGAMTDLRSVEDGAKAAVTEAQNGVAQARFAAGPEITKALTKQADKLSVERAHLEHELALVAEREEDTRADFRRLAAAVPGAADPPFSDGAVVPQRLVTEPHHGLAAHVVDDAWPTWFQAVVYQSHHAYGIKADNPRREVLA